MPKFKPDVLLLLEGLNDLDGTAAAQQTAISNLQSMIQMARGQGVRVIISTLLPQNPAGAMRRLPVHRNHGELDSTIQ